MPECSTCPLFHLEAEQDACLHLNRPGGLALTGIGLELAGLKRGTRILEAASGAGATLDYLVSGLGMDAVGLDASPAMLEMSRKNDPGHPLIQADYRQIPLIDGDRDAVLTECALSLAGEIQSTLLEYRRILAPGGRLIVTDIYIRELADPAGLDCLNTTRCLAGAISESGIRRELEAAGFRVRIWQDHTLMFKQWLGNMVFKLGSLQAFYRKLVSCDGDAETLCAAMGQKIKLGYYLMIAEKQTS
jgi:arsenite methyltransferase